MDGLPEDLQQILGGHGELSEQFPADRHAGGRSVLGMVVANMTDAVVVVDNHLRVVEINDSALELLGLTSCPPRLCLTPDVDPGEVRDANGRLIGFADSVHVRCLSGETVRGCELTLRKHTGETRKIVVDGSPVRNASGEVIMAVVVARDVTRLRELESRTRQNLQELREQRESLMCVIDNVPAGVVLLDPELRVLTANREFLNYFQPPGRLRPGARLDRCLPGTAESGLIEILQQVVRTGTPERFNEIRCAATGAGEVYWRGSAVPARLRLQDRTVEAVILVVLDVTDEVRSRTAIEEACRREHVISESLQRCFLPDEFPRIRGFEIAHRHRAGLDEALIGGDFYDAFRLSDGRYGLVIGDVAGQGLKAAVYTVMTRYMLRAYALEGSEPDRALARLNETLSQCTPSDVFVTLIYGVLDPDSGTFVYADAGNEPPVVFVAREGRARALESTGPGLALVKKASFNAASVRLFPGDLVVLYTDGITDAGGGPEGRFGLERLLHAVESTAENGAERTADCVVESALCFSGGRMQDDAAIVVIRMLP